MAFRDRLRKLPVFAAWSLAATAGLCLALGLLAESSWLCDLLTHFRWQYAATLVSCGILLVALRRPRTGLASLILGTAVLTPLLAPASKPAAVPTLKVISFNVLKTNDRRDAICDFLETENADVVVLSEMTEEWKPQIARLRSVYPHVLASSPKRLDDVVILSRHRLVGTSVKGYRKRRCVEALVTVNGLSYNLAAAHTSPPTGAANSEARNRQLQGIADELAGRPRTILCGDLNITPFSPWFARFLARSGLTNTTLGSGFSPTWMRAWPPIAVPIDHVLLSPDLALVSRTVGPSLGSDHSPVIVELAANPPDAALASRE